MGMTRKFLSAMSMGAVDWRSDKERVARSARLTKRATKRGNRLLKEQNRILTQQQAAAAPAAQPTPVQVAPGWYPDPQAPHVMRWWDGYQWTEHTAPRA